MNPETARLTSQPLPALGVRLAPTLSTALLTALQTPLVSSETGTGVSATPEITADATPDETAPLTAKAGSRMRQRYPAITRHSTMIQPTLPVVGEAEKPTPMVFPA